MVDDINLAKLTTLFTQHAEVSSKREERGREVCILAIMMKIYLGFLINDVCCRSFLRLKKTFEK